MTSAEALDVPCSEELPGTADFPECKPFPFQEYPSEDSASADLAKYHREQLKAMGVTMGRGGFDVKDLHDEKDLLEVCVGKLCVFWKNVLYLRKGLAV